MAGMDEILDALVFRPTLNSRGEVLARPCPVPAMPGPYAWYLSRLPASVPTGDCKRAGESALCYIGIAPKSGTNNAGLPSRPPLRTRLRYHFRGNAYGSTLRLTLGCLLAGDSLAEGREWHPPDLRRWGTRPIGLDA